MVRASVSRALRLRVNSRRPVALEDLAIAGAVAEVFAEPRQPRLHLVPADGEREVAGRLSGDFGVHSARPISTRRNSPFVRSPARRAPPAAPYVGSASADGLSPDDTKPVR